MRKQAAGLRVLIWTEVDQVGGADRYMCDLANGLSEGGAGVFLASNPYPPLAAYLGSRLRRGIHVGTVPVKRLGSGMAGFAARGHHAIQARRKSSARTDHATRESTTGTGFAATSRGAVRLLHAAWNVHTLRSLIRSVKPDVVHINNGGYPGADSCRWMAIAARQECVPVVTAFIHNMAFPYDGLRRVERWIDRKVDASLTHWMTAADATACRLADARNVERSRILTIPYGLPATTDQPSHGPRPSTEGELFLAAVAAFEPRKGHRVLIDSLTSLRDQALFPRVDLYGEGPERPVIESLVVTRGLEQQVRFLGWRDDVPRRLRSYDALVLPSVENECLPYVILEAMQTSLPVVATRVAGIPDEVIDGVTGFLAEPGDPRGLAEGIARLADPKVRRRLGAAGHHHQVSNFSLEAMIEATLHAWCVTGHALRAGPERR